MGKIIWLSPAYFPQIAQLLQEISEPTDSHEWHYLYNNFPTLMYGVIKNEKLIGFTSAYIHEKSAHIGHCIIHPHHRLEGYGSRLIVTLLKALGLKNSLYIRVHPENAGFFIRYGFTLLHETAYIFRPKKEETAYLNHTQQQLLTSENFLKHYQQWGNLAWGEPRLDLVTHHNITSSSLFFTTPHALCHSRMSDNHVVIEPWLVRYGADFDAEIILRGLIRFRGNKGLLCELPSNNTEALSLFYRYGFTTLHHRLIMVKGTPLVSRPEIIYSYASLGGYG